MSATFFERLHTIKSVLAASEAPQLLLPQIQSLLTDPALAREFWNRLDDSSWLDILSESGFFASPPEPEVSSDRMRYPPWSASRFLVRMAPRSPATVAAIFSGMHSTNPSVVHDMAEAACKMPPDVSATLVPSLLLAAKEKALWMAFSDASDLCVNLATDTQFHHALELADGLFDPSFVSSPASSPSPEEHGYEEGLHRVTMALTQVAPREILLRLCRWLEASIQSKTYSNADTGEDLSWSWRPAIEPHEQNHDFDFASTFVDPIRSSLEAAIDSGSLSLNEARAILGDFKYTIYQRIQLFLLARYASQAPTLACGAMLNKKMFEDYHVRHEYALLANKAITLLNSEQQGQWYKWIEDGPDMSNFDDSFRESMKREPTVSDRQARIDYWKFEKLHWIRGHLQGDHKTFYERMLKEQGEPELADLNSRVTTSWDAESPVTVDAWQGKSLAEVVAFVKDWQPAASERRGQPTMEGLAGVFSKFVGLNPMHNSTCALDLKHSPLLFVRLFIAQMTEAVKVRSPIDVHAVLQLCEWVINEPVKLQIEIIPRVGAYIDETQWIRDTIVSFAEILCTSKRDNDVAAYSYSDIGAGVWTLLNRLCQDAAPHPFAPSEQENVNPRLVDYFHIGINSNRGRAVRTALDYARWRGEELKVRKDGIEVIEGGFATMSEVRDMLEWQLLPANRTVDALSIIGSRVGLLRWLDEAWLTMHVEALCPLDDGTGIDDVAERWAAWNAFLVWVSPHVVFYKLFKTQFAQAASYAIDARSAQPGSDHSRTHPMSHLGEHLAVLYGRGQLDAEGIRLLQNLLKEGQSDLRRYIIGFVGKTLPSRDKEALPSEVTARFQLLWRQYWDGTGRDDASEKPTAWLFGKWFASDQFPRSWALAELCSYVEVVGIPEPDYAVVEHLAEIAAASDANSELGIVIAILSKMVLGDHAGWHVHGWIDSAKAILQKGLHADAIVRAESIALVNELGRRGFVEMGALLEE